MIKYFIPIFVIDIYTS